MDIAKIKNDIVSYNHTVSEKGEEGFRIHCHEKYEILFVIKGGIHYMIEGESYFAIDGSVLLIPPGVIHGIEANDSDRYERHVAHIDFDKAEDSTKGLLTRIFSKGRYHTLKDAANLCEAFDQMNNVMALDEKLFTEALNSVLLKLFLILSDKAGELRGEKSSSVFSGIINFINSNYRTIRSLDDITGAFFISKHHLNETFRKATGVTVWEYIIRKRIFYATTLIKSGVPALEAAEKSGFSDYSSFYKAYKKRTGKSPKK